MANLCAASVQMCAVRIARLGSQGIPEPGASNMYTTDGFAEIRLDPEVFTPPEIEEANGCGEIIVSNRQCSQEKWWNFSSDLLTADPELSSLLVADGVLHTLGGDTVGWGTRNLRTATCPDDVSVEFWTVRSVDGLPATDGNPYWRWVLPRVRNLRISAIGPFGNANAPRTFVGEAHENANWFDGPVNDFASISDVDADRAWQYVADAAIPAAVCGFQELAAS